MWTNLSELFDVESFDPDSGFTSVVLLSTVGIAVWVFELFWSSSLRSRFSQSLRYSRMIWFFDAFSTSFCCLEWDFDFFEMSTSLLKTFFGVDVTFGESLSTALGLWRFLSSNSHFSTSLSFLLSFCSGVKLGFSWLSTDDFSLSAGGIDWFICFIFCRLLILLIFVGSTTVVECWHIVAWRTESNAQRCCWSASSLQLLLPVLFDTLTLFVHVTVLDRWRIWFVEFIFSLFLKTLK